jgi:hypothetical protein
LSLQIPFECAITSAKALEGSPLLQRLNADEELDDWTILAVFLAQNRYYKRMVAGGTQDAASLARASGLNQDAAAFWSPYINALPSRTGAVLEWTQVELDSVRRTSAAVTAAQVTTGAAEAWQQVEPLVKAAVEPLGISPFAVTEETFRYSSTIIAHCGGTKQPVLVSSCQTTRSECSCRWGVCILLSRIIRLQDSPPVEALVPWADFINHSPASNAYVRVSTGVTGQIGALTNSMSGLQNSLEGILNAQGDKDPAVVV